MNTTTPAAAAAPCRIRARRDATFGVARTVLGISLKSVTFAADIVECTAERVLSLLDPLSA
jgi:hypothetical protein